MNDKEYDLYDTLKKYSYSQLKLLFKNSKTKEEQDFYMNLANFHLQQQQAKIIEKNK